MLKNNNLMFHCTHTNKIKHLSLNSQGNDFFCSCYYKLDFIKLTLIVPRLVDDKNKRKNKKR